jgi:hypothetical protein
MVGEDPAIIYSRLYYVQYLDLIDTDIQGF